MGSGRWTSDSFTTYASTTNYRAMSRDAVFSKSVQAELKTESIKVRESRDSADSPNSTPIILGLDVTGSMGEYAEKIAKDELPKLMNAILEQSPVADPHLMFMAVDDVHAYSQTPLQVSQFEADIRILEQLRKIVLVGGGGGNRSESYDLAWYCAGMKTSIDSFEKRGEKGFLFTFGDEEAPYETMKASELTAVFGPGQYENMQPGEILDAAKKMYNVFHIVIEQGSYARTRLNSVKSTWTDMLGNNVLFLKDFRNLSELVTSTIRIAKGEDLNTVVSNSSISKDLAYAYQNAIAQMEAA